MADMESQFTKFFAKLDRDLEDLSLGGEFSDASGNLMRDAGVLVLLAMAIAQSDEPGTLKAAAPALLSDGKALLAATDAAAAASAVEAMKAALESPASSTETVTWEKAVQLAPLMSKVVPSLTTEIKRLSKNEKTLLRAGNVDKVAGDTALLAIVAAGSRLCVSETSAPDQEALWKEYCDQFGALSLNVNRAAHALSDGGAFDEYGAALKELEKTCSVCHAKFCNAK